MVIPGNRASQPSKRARAASGHPEAVDAEADQSGFRFSEFVGALLHPSLNAICALPQKCAF
jgi:hypothetical protein